MANRYGTGRSGADNTLVPNLPTLRALTAGGAVAVTLAAVALLVTGQADTTTDDLLEIAAALFPALSCSLAALVTRGRLRLGWAALASACACWAIGESAWSVYELVLHREPFPSPADLGFLLFPVGALAALLVFPARASGGDRRRMTLDGLTTVTAVGLVSWSTSLGSVFHSTADSALAAGVSLAYPLSDIGLLVMCVLVLSRASGRRRCLALVAGGIALMAVADSAFAYATAEGGYAGGGLIDLGWYLAFLLLALAPLAPGALDEQEPESTESVAGGWLPYVPLSVAATVEISRYATGLHPGPVEAALCGLLMTLILLRQALTVLDNKRLATSLLQRERELRHQAFHDGLTGLANRALFVDRVTHALELHSRDGHAVAICFLDLDGFKHVNDTLGHAAGDELLQQVSARFLTTLTTADTLARFGGDEFAVLLEDDAADPMSVARGLLDALSTPFLLEEGTASVQVSIGVARVGRHDPTPSVDELLTRTDVAMYAVKRRGKADVLLYAPGLELDDATLDQRLAEALAQSELDVAFQPVVSLKTGLVDTLEALCRWSPDGHPMSADRFIAVAERAGLLDQLFEQVLHTALAQLSRWPAQVRVSVNLSPAQLTDATVDVVRDALRLHQVSGSRLVLELTESAPVAPGGQLVCDRLRALRVRMSVDDFGTGMSTLARLRELSIDEVKIDRSFVSRIDRDPQSQRFVRGVLAFAEQMGLTVVAEGVEEAAERDALTALGCPLAQGYLFSRPVSAEQVPALLVPHPARPLDTWILA